MREPNVIPDIILASSELADEGYWRKKGVFFVKPGSYRIRGLTLEGFSTAHDHVGGRRFGYGTFWQVRDQLNKLDINGKVVIGEGELDEAPIFIFIFFP